MVRYFEISCIKASSFTDVLETYDPNQSPIVFVPMPIIPACEKAGVQYFVKVSFYHARRTREEYQNVHLIKLHGKCDQLLAQSTIPYTILSASHYMSNALVMNHVRLLF